MTFANFCSCAKKYWYVVLIPVLVALAFAGFKLMSGSTSSYVAVSTINVNSSVATVGGIAKNSAEEYMRDNPGLSVKTASDDKNNIVTLTVSGKDESIVSQEASNLAEQIVSEAESFFPNSAEITPGKYVPFVAQAQSPVVSKSTQSGTKAIFTNLIVPLMLALVFAACAIVAIYMIRRPITRKEDIEYAFAINAVVPRKADSDFGDRLLANIRFATSQDAKRICVIPIQEDSSARNISEILYASLKSEGKKVERMRSPEIIADNGEADEAAYKVIDCAPVSVSTDTLYASRKADAVVLAAIQWKDSMRSLESAVEELKLAKANIALCVLTK